MPRSTRSSGTPLPTRSSIAMNTDTYDVIVAGAGPVGLTLAIDLGRRGVRCLIMERHPTTAPWPKMDRSNARTMEFYRRIGIVDRVRALGYPADNPMDVFLTTRLSDPPIAVLKYPSVAERRKQIAESPNGAWLLEPYQLVSQNKLEPLLKEVAEATPERHRALRLRTGRFQPGRRWRDGPRPDRGWTRRNAALRLSGRLRRRHQHRPQEARHQTGRAAAAFATSFR